MTDHLGTVHDLLDYDEPTATSSVVEHRTYDAFGQILTETSTIDHLFAYTGRYFDTSTNLQYNVNRWYDPSTGSWLSEDPISFAAGDANLYRYVGNRPTTHIDPNGTEAYSGGMSGGSSGDNAGDPMAKYFFIPANSMPKDLPTPEPPSSTNHN